VRVRVADVVEHVVEPLAGLGRRGLGLETGDGVGVGDVLGGADGVAVGRGDGLRAATCCPAAGVAALPDDLFRGGVVFAVGIGERHGSEPGRHEVAAATAD